MGLGGIFKKAAPFLAGGLGGYNLWEGRQARKKYGNSIKDKINYDFEQQKKQHDYDAQYNQQMAEWQFADAASRRAAAAATERNRQAAARKAQRIMDAAYGKSRDTFQPWVDTGNRLLPQVEQTYGNSLGSMNLLNAYLFQPQQIQKLDAVKPAYFNNIPLDSFFAGGKK